MFGRATIIRRCECRVNGNGSGDPARLFEERGRKAVRREFESVILLLRALQCYYRQCYRQAAAPSRCPASTVSATPSNRPVRSCGRSCAPIFARGGPERDRTRRSSRPKLGASFVPFVRAPGVWNGELGRRHLFFTACPSFIAARASTRLLAHDRRQRPRPFLRRRTNAFPPKVRKNKWEQNKIKVHSTPSLAHAGRFFENISPCPEAGKN